MERLNDASSTECMTSHQHSDHQPSDNLIQLADGVRRALGRAPRDFRGYARTVAASGLWQTVPTATTR